MKIEFKKVGLDRLPEIAEINQEIFDGLYGWEPYKLADYNQRLTGIKSAIFVALVGGKIVGNVIAYQKDKNFYSWILGVLPEYRGKRIASKLTDLIEDYARAEGYPKITTKVYNVSDRMLRHKIRRGYMITDIEKNKDIKFNAIHLELEL